MDVFEEIRTILTEILDLESREVTEESYLIRELGAESIDLLELTAALNARFRIKVKEDDLFLRNIRYRLKEVRREGGEILPLRDFPFLTKERLSEIDSDPATAPVLKVKDLVSYVAWQMQRA